MADDWITPPTPDSAAAGAGATPPAQPTSDWVTPPADHPVAAAPMTLGQGATDVAKSGASGLVKGVGGAVGMLRDAQYAIPQGMAYLAAHGAVALGLTTPENAAKFLQDSAAVDTAVGPHGSEAVNNAISDAYKAGGVDDSYAPQTTAGQYAQTVGEFLPGAVTGGAGETASLANAAKAALKFGVGPAVTSETAGQVTAGTPLEPAARLLGAVVGGAPAGIASALSSFGPKTIGQALKGVTEQQFTDAQNLVDASRAANTPLTLPEAIQHVTNGATTLGDVQRVVTQSAKGGPTMRGFYADRPAQTDALARSTFDEIAPAGVDPDTVAPAVQGAAQGAIDDARQAINAASKPHYDAAMASPIPRADWTALMQNPSVAEAFKQVVTDPIKYDTVAHLPNNSVGMLDAVKKQLDTMYEAAANPTNPDNYRASLISEAKGAVRDAATTASPDYAQGLQIQTEGHQNVLDPLERSPTGQLAASGQTANGKIPSAADQFGAQANVIFDPNPLPGSETAVGDAVKQVASVDPAAAQQLVRLHLERAFNEASQNLQSGPNVMGGANFAKVVQGNSQQAANLEAAVRALPDGGARWLALKNTVRIFEAQGRREAMGSGTAQNAEIAKGLSQGDPVGYLASTALSPERALSAASDLYHSFKYGQNTQTLANLFTTGDITALRKLALTPASSGRGMAVFGAAISSGLGQSDPDLGALLTGASATQ